jgi:hypothetical protein
MTIRILFHRLDIAIRTLSSETGRVETHEIEVAERYEMQTMRKSR